MSLNDSGLIQYFHLNPVGTTKNIKFYKIVFNVTLLMQGIYFSLIFMLEGHVTCYEQKYVRNLLRAASCMLQPNLVRKTACVRELQRISTPASFPCWPP